MDDSQFVLKQNTIFIWSINLDEYTHHLSDFWELLSPEEEVRANRFHFELDRNRYIISHGILRNLLGNILGLSPENVLFGVNTHGKPFIEKSQNNLNVTFNISHAKEALLIAVTCEDEIGVDVEKTNRDVLPKLISNAFFTEEECESLEHLEPVDLKMKFLTYWTRKEAFIKAIGMGVYFPLDEVSVLNHKANAWSIINCDDEKTRCKVWYSRDLCLSEGLIGAVAVQLADKEIAFCDYRKICGIKTDVSF